MIVYSTFKNKNSNVLLNTKEELFDIAFEENHYDDKFYCVELVGCSVFGIYRNVFNYISSLNHFTLQELKLLSTHKNLPYLINYINFLAKEDGYWFYELKEKLLNIALINSEYDTSYSECEETGGDIIYIQTSDYQFSFHNFDMKNYKIAHGNELRYKTSGKDLTIFL